MIKCRVHIDSQYVVFDRDVFIEIEIPCIMPIGSILYLGRKIEELEAMAKKSRDIASRYHPEWFYSGDQDIEFEKANIENLGFDDAMVVTNIAYYLGNDYVSIEIGDWIDNKD